MSILAGIQKGGWFYPKHRFGFGVTAKTSAATLSPGECGIVTVTGLGSVTLTLPSPIGRPGLWYLILNLAGQTLIVAADTADTLIAFNDLAADSLELSTAGNLIGGTLLFVSDGTSWIGTNLGVHTLTVNT